MDFWLTYLLIAGYDSHAHAPTTALSSSSKGSSTLHTTSSLLSLKDSYTYTTAGSFSKQTSSPLSAIMLTTPALTGLTINRKLSDTPLLNAAPVLKQLSLSVANLSDTPIFSSKTSQAHTADAHGTAQNDASFGNDEHCAEANNTSDAAASTEHTVRLWLQHCLGHDDAICCVCM